MAPTVQKVTLFLWFNTEAEEAAAFYTSIFPDSRIVTVTRYPEGAPSPKGTVMTVAFDLAGQRFTALNAGPMFKFNEAVSFVVDCPTQAEVDRYWEALTAGGGAPSQCGWLKDRYGLSWQIVPSIIPRLMSDPVRGARVVQALWRMTKPDVAVLEAAAEGRSVPVPAGSPGVSRACPTGA